MEDQNMNDLWLRSDHADQAWELFHENSKNSPYMPGLSDFEVHTWIQSLEESLDFKGYPTIELPQDLSPVSTSLRDAIITRASVREMIPSKLSLNTIATLLFLGYGVTRPSTDGNRSHRVVPSAGGLYPLEIFLYCSHNHSLLPGIYHYNPSKHSLRHLLNNDHSHTIAQAFLQPNIATSSSLIIFLTAMFERSIFKYGDRGYRYVLLEAGHVAQNINLVTNSLGLGCINIGGFFDRRIDKFLELDGITFSALYLLAIGGK